MLVIVPRPGAVPTQDSRPAQTPLCQRGWAGLWLAKVLSNSGVCFSAPLALLAAEPNCTEFPFVYLLDKPHVQSCAGDNQINHHLSSVAHCQALPAVSESHPRL